MRKKVSRPIRRAQIVNAAIEIISERGLKGLTIRAIAKKIGITTSNVYRHFLNKDELIEAIISDIGFRLEGIIENSRAELNSPVDQLELIFFNHLDFIERHRAIGRIIFSDEMYSEGSKIVMGLKRLMSKYLQEIKTILHNGVVLGNFHANLNVEAAAAMFLGVMQSMLLQWIVFRFSFSLKKRGERLWKIYLRSIVPG